MVLSKMVHLVPTTEPVQWLDREPLYKLIRAHGGKKGTQEGLPFLREVGWIQGRTLTIGNLIGTYLVMTI
jgi:hypothetical protein